MRASRIEKIGFFHCVHFDTSTLPVTDLDEALSHRIQQERQCDSTWPIANSLIVLPEAFNVGEYGKSGPGQRSREFLADLRHIAAEYSVILVTGVIDEHRRNAAYLIDAKATQLVCHKIGDDMTGIYDPYTGDADPCNPVTFSNARVGALICMDATNNGPHIRYRRERLLNRLKGDHTKVICVPSRFKWDSPELLPLREWRDLWYVVADGSWKRDRSDSFVADSTLKKVLTSSNPNEVKIWPLSGQAELRPIAV